MRIKVITVLLAVFACVAAAASAVPASAAVHHPRVHVSANHRSIRLGSTVKLSGSVSPHQRGHRIFLQRYYAHAWHPVKSTHSKTPRYAFRAKAAHTGTYKYRVFDGKTRTSASAHSRSVIVTAKGRASSGGGSSASCYSLTNSGNCYEPGELCRASDHGASGIAGNCEAITCEDNNGWRWEPS